MGAAMSPTRGTIFQLFVPLAQISCLSACTILVSLLLLKVRVHCRVIDLGAMRTVQLTNKSTWASEPKITRLCRATHKYIPANAYQQLWWYISSQLAGKSCSWVVACDGNGSLGLKNQKEVSAFLQNHDCCSVGNELARSPGKCFDHLWFMIMYLTNSISTVY